MEWTTDNRQWYRNVYLKSEHWKELRASKLSTRHKCEICGSRKSLDVHHVHYRNLFDVELRDLLAVCRKCHYEIHQVIPTESRQKPEFDDKPPDNRTERAPDCSMDDPAGMGPLPTGQKANNKPTVKSKAISLMFRGKCFLCRDELGDIYASKAIKDIPGKRWRYGIPVCMKCSSRELTEEEESEAVNFIKSLPPHSEANAFKVAQRQFYPKRYPPDEMSLTSAAESVPSVSARESPF